MSKINIIMFLMFLSIMISGCSIEYTENIEKIKISHTIQGAKIVTLEGCEYLEMPTTYGYNIYSHKGNCTNNIHIYRKAE